MYVNVSVDESFSSESQNLRGNKPFNKPLHGSPLFVKNDILFSSVVKGRYSTQKSIAQCAEPSTQIFRCDGVTE